MVVGAILVGHVKTFGNIGLPILLVRPNISTVMPIWTSHTMIQAEQGDSAPGDAL